MKWLLVIALALTGSAVCAQELSFAWEQDFQAAEHALEQHHYFEAHRIFLASAYEAARCQQEVQLASKLEQTAERYAINNHPKVAEALLKQALKIYENKLGLNDIRIVRSLKRFVSVFKQVNQHEQASRLETRAREILASYQS